MSLKFKLEKNGTILNEFKVEKGTDNLPDFRNSLKSFASRINSALTEIIEKEKGEMDTNTIEDESDDEEDDEDEADDGTSTKHKKLKTI